jgi:gas vesicle protein
MAKASITLALLLMPMSTFVLIFPICQITFAQGNVTQSTATSSSNDTIVGVIVGGAIGAAATIAVTILNMKSKKQDREHYLAIELLKLRTECYSTAFKITESIASTPENPLGTNEIGTVSDKLEIWYHQEKGELLMSKDSDLRYHGLQNTMGQILDPGRPGVDPVFYFTHPNTKRMMDNAIQFRLSLQRDLGVRKDVHET